MTDDIVNQRVVSIRNESYLVTCNQISEFTWVASGDCNGREVREKGSSKEDAFASWQRVVLFLTK